MAVVTISGQAGTGAREVGRLAADALQIDYVDQEILVASARELGVPLESVVSHDERTASLGERLGTMLRRFLERSAAAGAADPMMVPGGLDVLLARTYAEAAAGEGLPEVSDEQYIGALTGIVQGLAAQDDVLIIGRGSQVILRDCAGALHVLLVAPLKDRIAFIAKRDNVPAEEAEKRVQEGDRGRVSFHEKFFHVNPDKPALYQLTINAGTVSAEQAAGIIADAARRLSAPGARL